jgi:TetR/AcrR family transcriptional regulator
MVRLHRGEANALSPLVERFFRPLMLRTAEVLDEGIASGELIAVDPAQIRNAALGANVLYFLSAPLMQMVLGTDLLTLEALELRRTAAIDFLGQAIFTGHAWPHACWRKCPCRKMAESGRSQCLNFAQSRLKN